MNTSEIVRELRCVQEKHRNDRLLTFQTNVSAMARDAADMIESLQARLVEYDVLAAEYGIDGKAMLTLAKSQIKTAQDNIKLREQLAASQRRADAAVEDLENLIDRECACSYCSHLLETGACALDIKYGDGTCSAQWRGPQDEKGDDREI